MGRGEPIEPELTLLGKVTPGRHNIVAILVVIVCGLGIGVIGDDLHRDICNLLHWLRGRLVGEARIALFLLSPSRLLGDLLPGGSFPFQANALLVAGMRHTRGSRDTF
jgi:hypothetical protein